MVELLIILPVLALILIAMFYIGQLSLYKERTHFGGEYAMDAQGDQSEEAAVRGEVTEHFYPSHVGELTVVERPPDPAEIPETGELRQVFDEMSEIIYSTVAVGRYVFSGGQLRFVVTTHQSQELSADGRYVAANHLRDNNIPELSTELLQGWAQRNRVDLQYSYEPDYLRVGRWPLESGNLATRFQSTIRGEKSREAASPPPGMNHQIDTVTSSQNMRDPGQLPHYPDFGGAEPFWRPN